MIGRTYKKFAEENGLQIAQGVAFGNFRGYSATLSEGSGYKQIVINTKFTDPARLQELQAALNQRNLSREFRVQNLQFHAQGIAIVFQDNPGTMKKIQAFVDWFMPLLPLYGATGVNCCAECGFEVTGGRWVLINGVAFHMHDACAQKAMQSIAEDNTQQAQEAKGSYLSGFIGALLGATVGAVLWALILLAGYVASIVGLVIGILAEKGYNLLKGKQGKAKVAILILAVLFGVIVGTLGADVFTLLGMISNGEIPLAPGDIPLYIISLFAGVEEYRSATLASIGQGILFAGLGVFALLRKTGKDVSGTQAKYLV
jgi:hypothetical protein